MAVPLTPAQQQAVSALVAVGRIEAVPVDANRSQGFLRQAEEALADLPNLTRTQNSYNLSYDAAHDVGEALLAAYGYRTKSGPGQHEAVGRFLTAVFDAPPADSAARHFDRMRRERNQARYNARPVTAAAAQAAESAARTLVRVARTQAV